MNTGVMDPLNPTEAEFDTAMTEIDQELRRKSSRVVAREMLALAEYCHRYNYFVGHGRQCWPGILGNGRHP